MISSFFLRKRALIGQQPLLVRKHARMQQLQQHLRLLLGAADHGQPLAKQKKGMG